MINLQWHDDPPRDGLFVLERPGGILLTVIEIDDIETVSDREGWRFFGPIPKASTGQVVTHYDETLEGAFKEVCMKHMRLRKEEEHDRADELLELSDALERVNEILHDSTLKTHSD